MLHSLKQFRIVQLYLTYILVFASLSCTLGQILILPLRLLRPKLFYVLNEKLCYFYFCLVPYAVENWAGYTIRVYGEESIVDNFRQSPDTNRLVVMNHTGEVDWMIGWSLIESLGLLGRVKTVIKDPIKYVPLFGWTFYISDYIFVKRSAQTDLPILRRASELYRDYPHSFLMTIFPEGTRYTEEKHAESLAFASKRGLPQYKHHLLPRAKGLHFLLGMMKRNKNSEFFYDIEYAYRGKPATAIGILSADRGKCDVNMRAFRLTDIPEEEGAFTEWLYQLFEEKDALMAFHKERGHFPGQPLQTEPSYWRGKCALFWFVASTLPILYTSVSLVLSGHWALLALLTLLLPAAASWLFDQLIRMTESKHGSAYGLRNSAVNKSN